MKVRKKEEDEVVDVNVELYIHEDAKLLLNVLSGTPAAFHMIHGLLLKLSYLPKIKTLLLLLLFKNSERF